MDTPGKAEVSVTIEDMRLVAKALGVEPEKIKSITIEIEHDHPLTGAPRGAQRMCYCGNGRFSSTCCH